MVSNPGRLYASTPASVVIFHTNHKVMKIGKDDQLKKILKAE
jgi:hypothetical protein